MLHAWINVDQSSPYHVALDFHSQKAETREKKSLQVLNYFESRRLTFHTKHRSIIRQSLNVLC